MKCDELKYEKLGDMMLFYPRSTLVIRKQFVDASIAELKDKCQMHDFFWEGCGFAKRGFKNTIAVSEAFDKLEAENAELKQKLESVQASAYAESVDAGMENRKLKAVHAFDVYEAYTKTGDDDAAQVYIKSEADKVIEKKDKEITELKNRIAPKQSDKTLQERLNEVCEKHGVSTLQDLDWAFCESEKRHTKDCIEAVTVIAHQKYKRCLAMAEACMHKCWRNDEGFDYARSTRHMKKWLDIAEKFKEAK